ncbi:8-oxo-dGTP diphosphatase [Patescibacteria group bacterium]|nr:8-oxo-dGTP diphosphatase [Patescibacteria group bacterium]
MKKILTLCVIHRSPKILLGMKKRGFGAGRWNGFGGKLNEGETIEEGLKRETKEEVGVEINDFNKVGIIEFEFKGNPEILEVHIFRASDFSGEPAESEEMKPQWFNQDELPFDSMWPDDIHWFPFFLSGKKFRGRFLFGENDVILKKRLFESEQV